MWWSNRSRGSRTGAAPRPIRNRSEAIVGFDEAELGVAVAGEDVLDHCPAACISEIEAQAQGARGLIVGADIVERGETGGSVGGTAIETEGPGLKRAAARIPEIVTVAEPQPVHVGAQSDALVRAKHEFAKQVRVVHLVEERETGVDARRGQDGEKSAVRVVGRIAVAAGVEIPGAQPGLDGGNNGGLVTA